MLRQLLLIAALLGACARPLTEPSTTAAPEFLGPLSGVYAAIDDSAQGETATIVVQYQGGLILAPYDVGDDGLPQLEIFATNLVANPVSGLFETVTDIRLPITEFFGGAVRCSDEAPLPTSAAEYFALNAQCATMGCTMPCFMSSMFELADGMQAGEGLTGECTSDGTTCLFRDMRFAGRFDSTGMTFYFPDASLLPPSKKVVACPDADPPWARCLQFEKLCAFDPRLAGVYRLSLTSASGGAPREMVVALAAEPNLAAAALVAGACTYFGALDPFTLELELAGPQLGGESCPMPNGSRIVGRLVESGDVVRFTGTWSEGGDELAIEGSRQSGSSPGRTCGGGCIQQPITCPGGGSQPDGHELLFSTRLDAHGCPHTTCERFVERAALCLGSEAALPCAGASELVLPFGSLATQLGRATIGCLDGSAACGPALGCLELACEATDPLRDAMFVTGNCAGSTGPLHLSFGFLQALTISCLPTAPYCSPFPPLCPLGAEPGINSSIEPIQTEPCWEDVCWQNVRDTMLCGGGVFPSCSDTEAAVASLDATGCVRVVCEPRDAACVAEPTARVPAHDAAYGVDVAERYGCPFWRAHVP